MSNESLKAKLAAYNDTYANSAQNIRKELV